MAYITTWRQLRRVKERSMACSQALPGFVKIFDMCETTWSKQQVYRGFHIQKAENMSHRLKCMYSPDYTRFHKYFPPFSTNATNAMQLLDRSSSEDLGGSSPASCAMRPTALRKCWSSVSTKVLSFPVVHLCHPLSPGLAEESAQNSALCEMHEFIIVHNSSYLDFESSWRACN